MVVGDQDPGNERDRHLPSAAGSPGFMPAGSHAEASRRDIAIDEARSAWVGALPDDEWECRPDGHATPDGGR